MLIHPACKTARRAFQSEHPPTPHAQEAEALYAMRQVYLWEAANEDGAGSRLHQSGLSEVLIMAELHHQ